jgi:hypothetical protein
VKKFVLTAVATAALLASATAAAEPAGKESSVKGDRTSGGGAPAGPGEQGPAPSIEDSRRLNADRAQGTGAAEKPWEVVAGWEGHRLIRQSDLEGAAPDKYLNYYSASVAWDFTKKDRVAVNAGVYQRFIADPNETGLRMDDTELRYRRLVPLPQDFTFTPSASVFFPTSFVSWRESLIVAPRAQLRLDKKFGEYVNVDAKVNGTYYWERYNTMSNGGTFPNPLVRLGGAVGAEVAMPFHKPLSFEIVASNYYQWYHNATSTMPNLPGAGQAGVTTTNTPSTQPASQAYGGEVRARYTFPALWGIESDAMIAYARDPGSTLHDGITHLYLFYRLQSEVYAALSAKF